MPYDLFKRGMDILAATLGLLLAGPFFLYLAWLIRKDTPGPIFFLSPRAGKGGRVFQMLKFRTMYECPESYSGPRVTAQDDPRITPLGKWLRDSKLNELPQLWNVLNGEMSLVGPRPEDPQIAANWPDAVRHELLSVRPGITSPASVVYRNEEKLLNSTPEGRQIMSVYLEEILPSKLRLDQLYVRNRSLWSDLDVLFWTFLTFIPRIQTATLPETWLFTGPIFRLMRRYVNWFTGDFIVTLVAIGITGLAWRSFGPLNVGWMRAAVWAFAFALLFSIAGAIMGVDRINWSKAAPSDGLDLLLPIAVATSLALALNNLVHTTRYLTWLGQNAFYWSKEPLLPQGLVLTAASLALVGFIVTRYRVGLITGLAMRWVGWRGAAATQREKVLVAGGGNTGEFVILTLTDERYTNSIQVVGLVDDDIFKQGVRIQGVNVLGRLQDIPRIVQEYDIGLIVFAIHNISAEERLHLLWTCTSTPARLVVFPDLHAALGQAIQQAEMEEGGCNNGQKEQARIDLMPLTCA
jgi:lipopolysaccharide/colanic/teichoic acid biosynthesis glycosyltransferase